MSPLLRAAALCLILSACAGRRSSLPFYRTATMTPEWLGANDAAAPSMHRVAPFRLIDQNAHVVTDTTFANKVTVVHFFFTRCGDVCPTTTTNLARILRETEGDPRIQVLSHSVTPSRDSVAVLHDYAVAHGIIDPRWHLLTGSGSAIEQLARDSYFVRLGDGATYGVESIAHTESMLLVDGRGRLRGVYAGTLGLEMQRLREDLETLVAEQ